METKTAAEERIAKLHHYAPFDAVHLARIFTDGTLYCSNPGNFNDPWDCRPCFSKAMLEEPSGHERIATWFAQLGRKYFPLLPEAEHRRREHVLRTDKTFLAARIDESTAGMWDAIQKQYRVFCLTPHCDSSLMWAHYARSHRGVCLEFSVSNMLMCGALPVQYVDHYPAFDLADNDEDASLRSLVTKSKDWSYEHEFRLIVAAPGYSFPNLLSTSDNFVALPNGALESVIMGCLMPEADREVIRTLVKGAPYPVELRAAHRVVDRYALEIRPAS